MALIPYVIGTIDLDYTPNANRKIEASGLRSVPTFQVRSSNDACTCGERQDESRVPPRRPIREAALANGGMGVVLRHAASGHTQHRHSDPRRPLSGQTVPSV